VTSETPRGSNVAEKGGGGGVLTLDSQVRVETKQPKPERDNPAFLYFSQLSPGLRPYPSQIMGGAKSCRSDSRSDSRSEEDGSAIAGIADWFDSFIGWFDSPTDPIRQRTKLSALL